MAQEKNRSLTQLKLFGLSFIAESLRFVKNESHIASAILPKLESDLMEVFAGSFFFIWRIFLSFTVFQKSIVAKQNKTPSRL